MQSVSKAWKITIGLFVSLLSIGLMLTLSSTSPKKSATNSGQHLDSFSGETVSSPSGKTPEAFGTASQPLMLGFDKLLNYGIDTGQLSLLSSAFANYSESLSKPLSQVSVGESTITSQGNSSDPTAPFVILFKVQFNGSGKIYIAKDIYTGLSDMRLLLIDPTTNKQLFDSGTLSIRT